MILAIRINTVHNSKLSYGFDPVWLETSDTNCNSLVVRFVVSVPSLRFSFYNVGSEFYPHPLYL